MLHGVFGSFRHFGAWVRHVQSAVQCSAVVRAMQSCAEVQPKRSMKNFRHLPWNDNDFTGTFFVRYGTTHLTQLLRYFSGKVLGLGCVMCRVQG